MPPNKSKRPIEESPERRFKRRRLNEEDEEEDKDREHVSKSNLLFLPIVASSKKAPVYSGGAVHKPAELFRKDLISAMKLPDSEPLNQEDYLLIADPWRQEWERGVQVPVNDVTLPVVEIREVCEKPKFTGDFKNTKKFLHGAKDDTYQLGIHELTGMAQLAEQVVRYDLDDLDVSWLQQLNDQRDEVGEQAIHEWIMERVIEALEHQCHENMETKKKTEEGLGIEYDEDIVCEICQSPDSEDSNEMVFCDGCDICVHQACYGIQTVPEGSWLCRTCALGIKPQCMLCPKVGGAMKSTKSGTKWAHVSCAIWIPEVTIGCVEKMEPVTKISMIPASRWSLVCCVCKERYGACIQCAVKSCKTAFHVTCAIADKLEMKTVLVEEKNIEDVKLKAYCPKHSKKHERNGSESEPDSPRKSIHGSPVKESQMTEEERATLRAERLHRLEEEFYHLVNVGDIALRLELAEDIVDLIYNYWKLKRRSMFNRPLLTPKTDEADLLEKQQEDSLVARMKMFVHLRQDLERVRNLTYMINRREKMKRQFTSSRESVFYSALEVLTDKTLNLTARDVHNIVKSYKDLPPPYCKTFKNIKTPQVEHKTLPCETPFRDKKSCVRKPRVKVKHAEEMPLMALDGTETLKPKPKRGRPRIKNILNNLKTDINMDMSAAVTQTDVNNSALDTRSVNNSISEDGMMFDNLLNTSQSSSIVDNGTLLQSESATEISTKEKTVKKVMKKERNSICNPNKLNVKAEEQSVNELKTENVKCAPDKKRKRSNTSGISTEAAPAKGVEIDSIVADTNGEMKTLQEDSKSNEKMFQKVSETSEMNTLPKDAITSEIKTFQKDSKPSEMITLQKDTKTRVSTEKRERRHSSAIKLSESEKEELLKKFPSAKNVSDHVKAELNGYLKNNKLVVSKNLRQKVQNALLTAKQRNRFGNGIIIDHAQKRNGTFFVKSPPSCDLESSCDNESLQSPDKQISRVLNELSPTRDRCEVNNIEKTERNITTCGGIRVLECEMRHKSGNTPNSRQSLVLSEGEKSVDLLELVSPNKPRRRYNSEGILSVKEKLFECESKRKTRSSRDTSPESTAGSAKSFSSYKKKRQDNHKARTRSITPLSTGKDSDESECENICADAVHRIR